jgi:hypothetical protein
VDKPLSQERLKPEQLEEIERQAYMNSISSRPELRYPIGPEVVKLVNEIKRLQAIETQKNLQTKYIGFLKSVIRSGETLGKYEDIEEFAKSIKGADTNESN